MVTSFQLGENNVEVVLKDIKNIHLSVYPPNGRVRIAAPIRMDLETIKLYTISKLSWIKQQQKKILSQPREAKREYITQESHYYLGKRYLLKIIEEEAKPKQEYLKQIIQRWYWIQQMHVPKSCVFFLPLLICQYHHAGQHIF